MAGIIGLPDFIQRGLHRAQMAAISAPGSIAARDNPAQYGSIASREYPGLFNPAGAQADAAYQQRVQHQAAVDQNVNDQIYTDRAMQNAGLRKTVAQQQAEDEQRQKNWAYQNQQHALTTANTAPTGPMDAVGVPSVVPSMSMNSGPGDPNYKRAQPIGSGDNNGF